MSSWRPNTGIATATRRAELLQRARNYFAKRDVLSVDVPAIAEFTVTDPQIESFALVGRRNFLHTSPEYPMKRLLAAGFPDIYSICRVFRDGELGRRHLPEFTMIEWYRRDMALQAIIDDTINLVTAILQKEQTLAVEQADYADILAEATGIDCFSTDTAALADAADADDALRKSVGDDRNAWLDLLMTSKVVPSFAPQTLTVVRHYPAAQAALARLCPEDQRVADRFEVFCGELELANGYVELTDAAEQARRMAADNTARQQQGKPAMVHDVHLLAALEAGLPACAGVALGFERLHMLDAGADDIRNVVSFAP